MTNRLNILANDQDHALGDRNARVTLVEYGDFECSSCGAAYPIVKSVVEQMGANLRLVFRNFPLTELHPHAQGAAEAAEAAGAQGAFWQMHDLLFENQRDLSGRALLSYAALVVPDTARWAADVDDRTFSAKVWSDVSSGERSGVHGTPTFFINGVRHVGAFDETSLLSAIEAALDRSALSA